MQRIWSSFKRYLSISEVNRFILILALSFVIYKMNPFFYTSANLKLIAVWGSIYSLMVLGQLLYLLTGGMDLSFGGVICISNVFAAVLILRHGFNMWIAIIIVLILGAAIGFITGLFATTFSPPFKIILPVFIFTLMLNFVLTGIARIVTKAFPVYGFKPSYSIISKSMLGPIPIVFIYMLVILLLLIYFLYFKSIGWQIYATGLNDEVARKVGVNIKKVRLITYSFGSMLQAFAGVIIGSYLSVGSVL
ncbi:MAG: ABC transporter permease, partial [Candidatus Humimicrobiaceae bacterium]